MRNNVSGADRNLFTFFFIRMVQNLGKGFGTCCGNTHTKKMMDMNRKGEMVLKKMMAKMGKINGRRNIMEMFGTAPKQIHNANFFR